jgi:hypothetical protein
MAFVLSDKTTRLVCVRISWTHASRRHGVARRDARYVVVHCGLVFLQPAPTGSAVPEDRFVYLGDDPSGRPLEVIGVELETEDGEEHLRVIHVMELRAKYRSQYEEAKQWRV